MTKLYIGIDFGGTNLKIGIFNADMDLLAKANVPSGDDLTPDTVVKHMVVSSKKLLADNNLSFDDVCAVGVGCPGQMNLKEGLVLSAPNLAFRNVPLRKILNDQFGKPSLFENDANAAAWGEFVAGSAKDVSDMVFFTLGTGIGGGIICEGKMIHGYTDEAAELGHIIVYPHGERMCGCGQYGCAEAYASANSTAARANDALGDGDASSLQGIFRDKRSVTCKDVFNHAQSGDELATKVVDGTAETLGLLCVSMLHVTQPQRIVFAGGMIAAGNFLLEKIVDQFNRHIWTMKKESLEICFATLGEDAGIYGAAALAIDL